MYKFFTNIWRVFSLLGIIVTLFLPFNKLVSASGFALVEYILLSASMIVIPLGLQAAFRDESLYRNSPLRKSMIYLFPLAMIALSISFFLEVGIISGVLSCVWLIFSLLVSYLGLQKLLLRGIYLKAETLIDMGLLYLAGGAAWLSASRFGIGLFGFSPLIVVLTAIHFHLAGFGLSILIGQITTLIKNKKNNYILIPALLISLTPVLVAIGINSSALIEVITAPLLALSLMLFSINSIKFLLNRFNLIDKKLKLISIVLIFSLTTSLITMLMATAFSLGQFRQDSWLSVDQMIHYHGFLNYFGFLVPSLFCLSFLKLERSDIEELIPFQKLEGRPFIGNNYFGGASATALYPEFEKTFKLENMVLGPMLLMYFKDTQKVHLICKANWQKGFHSLSKIVHVIGTKIGQLVLPLDGKTHTISNKLFQQINGVGSVRTFEDGSPMYITSYSSHKILDKPYMNISLPIPCGQLHSILEVSPLVDNNRCGLKLTSKSIERLDTGLWLDFKFLKFKIPLRETLEIWDLENQSKAKATHHFWFCGIKCLILDYIIIAKDS